jgi:KDO2-lipid IV(A) lauroyltransferase
MLDRRGLRRLWNSWVAYPVEAALARVLFGLFAALPIDRASALGGWIARSIGPRLGITRRAARSMKRALPELSEADIQRHLVGMWDNLGRVTAEYPHLASIKVYQPHGRVEVAGLDHADRLLAEGRQIIFISAHYGNWEIATLLARQRGIEMAQIYRAANNPRVDRIIGDFRDRGSFKFIPKGAVAARGAIAALKDGGNLALLADQKMNDGVAVPFFGRDAMTAPAWAQLAQRFNCAVLPVRIERVAGARFRATIEPPFDVPSSGDRQAQVMTALITFNRLLEDWIRARPDQWFWLHRRWPDS